MLYSFLFRLLFFARFLFCILLLSKKAQEIAWKKEKKMNPYMKLFNKMLFPFDYRGRHYEKRHAS